jgi:RimJ/RimL family protein N-acetyltransferase
MLGILVHGDNHFIVDGHLPDREIALALIRHWSLIQIGAVIPPQLAPWRIVTQASREDLEWAVVIREHCPVNPAVDKLLAELSARGVAIHSFELTGAEVEPFYFLRSKRLGFRKWTERDLALAIGLWGDPEVTRFTDSRPKLSTEDVNQLLTKQIAMEREHGIQYWPVFLLEDGEHVGCCGLRPYDSARQVHELGVHIRPGYWRRGLAVEAASATIQYAFEKLGATALFAGHNPHNHASRWLLGKLGFTCTHAEYYPATGLDHPSYLLVKPPAFSATPGA